MQQEIDMKNSEFWNELCGTGLARSLGITEVTPESIKKFDDAYMKMYPYLLGYVTNEKLSGKKVLEIGLGYGTLGSILASRQCEYYGLDISAGPCEMMRYRLMHMGKEIEGRIRVGSALDIPFPDESFDFVYTIGCLHHTGDITKSVNEVYRILRPGGKAVVMLYNKHSFRQIVHTPLLRMWNMLKRTRNQYATISEKIRSLYDTDSSGQAAPHTDFVSRADIQQIFARFTNTKMELRNFDDYIIIPRSLLLPNLGRILGLDWYIVAVR
jgi:ubiquinone/menaquinone biosynthesis C-methylase UbiE